ncbi:DUF2075 domain-containing protein [Isoptericola sp. AK164]|uniref:DUF2075 domain-containing protein n=1 Tax=Isoptericola sp. AK164 TaxID=3024246 RepID=UPI002418B358|nr:DUF2075 domain-containing protein [Isoptericola sp. AK164]
MTSFEISSRAFSSTTHEELRQAGDRYTNWPVVYVLDDGRQVYVGETGNVANRMRQHAETKSHLEQVRIVLDDTFNKSVCLDLESHLIRYFSGDAKLEVLNRNDGVIDADYFLREDYKDTFKAVFEELRSLGLFERSIPEIENSDLFKYSPFKALTQEQAIVIEDVLEGLFVDLEQDVDTTAVIEGEPGTGKTIVAVFLLKLLRDIATLGVEENAETDTMFSDFFAKGHREMLEGKRIGFVIPQQSLRKTIQKVFRKTPRMKGVEVIGPFDVGAAQERFDLLVVDEAHRLGQRANQPSASLNSKYTEINLRLFGNDDSRWTQLDWIRRQSKHTIFLLDSLQSVKPADIPRELQRGLVDEAQRGGRIYRLMSQMRVRAGSDYVRYVRRVLGDAAPDEAENFSPYDLRFFDDLGEMRAEIARRNQEVGLGRLVAGYAWPWVTKKDPTAYDIELDGERLRWNQAPTDWINSATSPQEVGSIHTVQGYDLNYAGVIVGPDLRYDRRQRRLVIDRANYHDKKGKENNPRLGIVYTDEDLRSFILNIYAVLMTRGIIGTYVYVCDPELREYLRPYFSVPA